MTTKPEDWLDELLKRECASDLNDRQFTARVLRATPSAHGSRNCLVVALLACLVFVSAAVIFELEFINASLWKLPFFDVLPATAVSLFLATLPVGLLFALFTGDESA